MAGRLVMKTRDEAAGHCEELMRLGVIPASAPEVPVAPASPEVVPANRSVDWDLLP